MTDCRAITKIKQQKKACFEAKSGSEKILFLYAVNLKGNNSLKRQLNPEKTAISMKKKGKSESLTRLSYQNHLSKQTTIELVWSLSVKHESSMILEAYTSTPFIKTNEINTTTWSKIRE
jgi:hypothetical protein